MPEFDFGALQDLVLDPTTDGGGVINDGLFDRLVQILKASQPPGRLQSVPDAMVLFRHVLRRQSLRAGQEAQLRIPSRGGWPDRVAWASYGVRAHSEANGYFLIEARPWRAPWLADSDNPVFEDIFKQFDGDLPAITKFTVWLSDAIIGRWYVFILGISGTVFAFRRWKTSVAGRKQWDTLRLKLPFKIGDIVQKVALARWSRTLSALTTAGVPLMQALEITGKTAGNWQVEKAMDEVITSVRSGGTIAAPLKESPIFPSMVTHMLGVGEETGALDTMLDKVADFYEDQVAAAVKALTSILEPVMIVIVGGIVGFIVIALYMPMFKVYDSIQ